MRVGRAKKYKKLMKAYEVSFNFREPYQVLLDAPFIRAAHGFKMHLGQMLENTLTASSIKPMITQCCIRELYNLKPANKAEEQEKERCIEVAKAAERRRCGHHELEEPLDALDCLVSVIDPKGSGTNKHRYIVASQNQDVRRRLREIAGVPLIYINRSVMILEPLAGKTEEVREREEKGKIRAGLKSRKSAQAGTKREREEDVANDDGAQRASQDAPARKKKKMKGPKEPNPLSVMRSKKISNSAHGIGSHPPADGTASMQRTIPNGGTEDAQKKRKRKRTPKLETGEITP